ncbi:hypothetical protein VKI22_15045 [Cyanobacterium aponinum UTEX 3221]|uniref:hypothetical protein n=1 Tax=Cyanobacterium aponinum TaxID=379064 RepID=UPI002B4C1949|nr:hypothetical protein [Cyanobacterium aponinum]WRL37917.1 hypothetical protein VKI22_15045 [Cyanobacterium aponinum UTEX 3221]
MWGKFQQSELRIEVSADEKKLRDSLLNIEQLEKWFFPLKFQDKRPNQLKSGDKFTIKLGLVEVKNEVEIINSNCIRFMLSGGIDGYQEWCWGDGWIQSRLEGVSVMPLNFAQTMNLLRLRTFVGARIEERK